MASLKKLAGQTAWYGVSSIAARFLSYLLTPYLTYKLTAAQYGEQSALYSAIPFLNVVFTFGMETAYFRYANKGEDEKKVFSTASFSLITTTVVLTIALLLLKQPIADLLNMSNHSEFFTWAAYAIALDTLSTLPFARLRYEGRPRKYAAIRIASILIFIGAVYFFYSGLPWLAKTYPGSFFANWYNPEIGAGYYVIANIISSGITLVMLLPEFRKMKPEWNGALFKEMILYSLPIMVAGFGGMINETFDRIMLAWWAPVSGQEHKMEQVGIYAACYKLSLLITLFIQAFRMGAEPFFFQQAKGEGAQKTYARVMKFFVMTICVMFLFVVLYMDIWKQFIRNRHLWVGLNVVPILLLANMSLGVYYNLSIWYKVSHKTSAGATITLIGALITLVINYFFIPRYSYLASAWATFACYAGMMIISYVWGQRVYPVPYPTKKLGGYFALMLGLYFADMAICYYTPSVLLRIMVGTVLLFIYLAFLLRAEREELSRLPVIGRFVR